ncbi:hypothetical protein ACFV97_31140 [Streptomyces sp. NPDC059913]|uniref:hypothetical protein n=1 Tax=unclassified Streptomyces TaxID=2593676 RepID=UPI003659BF8D
MDSELAHGESVFINFRRSMRDPKEHGFRWVDIKQLRFSAEPVDDEGLLAALIGHEQFRDDYAGGGVLPDGPRHGPYWLGSITPDLYAPISQEKAVQILRIGRRRSGTCPPDWRQICSGRCSPAWPQPTASTT